MMNEVIFGQAHIFFGSIGFGLLIGLDRDIWNGFWKYKKAKLWFTDAVFWMLTGIILFLFAEWMNQGSLRGYLFLGWLLGWLVYRRFIRRIVKRLWISCTELLKKVIKAVKISIGRR
jgi:spore cortex biosynthesis protein YabQ